MKFATTLRLGLVGLAFSLLAGAASAQPGKKDQPVTDPLVPVPTSTRTHTLGECLEIGANQQPTVRAAIASLKAAESGVQSLKNLSPVAKYVSPDLPLRIQQGEKGLIVASADVEKALQETKYDIIRMYYSFVYARQQDNTIEGIIGQLEVFYEIAQGLFKDGNPQVDQFKLYFMREAISGVRKLRVDARIGQSMALAALKEAMGVDASYDFLPRDMELPVMGGTVTQDQVVNFALCRRPEIAIASAGMDAFQLEVKAQNKVRIQQKVQTLAIGSDLHSRLIPGPHRNGDYRPGALAPEMPPILVGSRKDRTNHACEISGRADVLFDKTRNLVTLEAINTYLTWQAATEKMRQSKVFYDDTKSIAQKALQLAATRRDPEMSIRFQALEGKAQAEYITAVFEHLKSLATLERVTSGGVCPEFVKASDASK